MSARKSSSIWDHFTVDLLLLLGLTSNFCTIQFRFRFRPDSTFTIRYYPVPAG